MAERTAILWAEATWNPVLGCRLASAGCQHCYAIRVVDRMAGNPDPAISAPAQGLVCRGEDGRPRWTGEARCLSERLAWPYRWRRPPARKHSVGVR